MIPDRLTILALNSRQRSPSCLSSVFRSSDVVFPPDNEFRTPEMSRCQDDTRASSDLTPASFRRAHIDDPAQSTVSRQLRRCLRGVARRSNDRHPLHVASSCVAVDRVGHPRTDEVRLKLEKIISVQSSRCWTKRTSDLFKRAKSLSLPPRPRYR